jgi:hypothetical protein
MRLVIFLILVGITSLHGHSQQPNKAQMQSQMNDVIVQLNQQIDDLEKQIAEAKKNKEDPESIKDMEEQLAALKKQVKMMGGLNKDVGKISGNTFQQANQKSDKIIPEKDLKRISKIPKENFSDGELVSFVKTVFAKVEKKLPAEEIAASQKIYNEVKSNYNKTKPEYKFANVVSNAATGCWVYGHWEKAIWLAGKAYLEDINDLYKLNNYASYLSMVGCEDLAIPILIWLSGKRPESSTVQNNLGQAWFGLGDMDNAKQYLKAATSIDQYHSAANHTLSKIYTAENNYMLAIPALKASMKYCYTPEKAAELEKIGGELEDEDIDFNYPMPVDPFGFEAFFSAFPPLSGSLAESPKVAAQWRAFYESVNALDNKLKAEEDEAVKRAGIFAKSLVDQNKSKLVTEHHRTYSWMKAQRKLPLANKKRSALTIEQIMDLMGQAYDQTTTQRLNALEEQTRNLSLNNPTCREWDAINTAYLNSANAIIQQGIDEMNRVYSQHKREIQSFLKLLAYGTITDYGGKKQFEDALWERNQWIYRKQWGFVQRYRQLRKYPPTVSSACNPPPQYPEQIWVLPELKKPPCPFKADIKTPVGSIKERCNTIVVDESKLKYKRDNSQKGEIKKVMEEIGEIIDQAINPLNITAGEPTIEYDPADMELTFTEGDIEILESEPSDGRKLQLEMETITVKTEPIVKVTVGQATETTVKITVGQATPSTSNLSVGFDAGGNVMVNTSRCKISL